MIITDADEITAFAENLAALTPCTTCGGGRALVIEHGSVLPVIAHRTDCADVVEHGMRAELRLILGDDQ